MTDQLKGCLWVIFLGAGIGISTQLLHNSTDGIEYVSGTLNIGIGNVIYGCIFVCIPLFAFFIFRIASDIRFYNQTSVEWKRRNPTKSDVPSKFFLIRAGIHMAIVEYALYAFILSTVATALFANCISARRWFGILTHIGVILAGVSGVLISRRNTEFNDLTIESRAIEFFGFPKPTGLVIVFVTLFAFFSANEFYPYSSQSLGGGRPLPAVIYIEKQNSFPDSVSGIRMNILYQSPEYIYCALRTAKDGIHILPKSKIIKIVQVPEK